MVGIVIVSHSMKLADGIKDLAGQMADKQLKIIAAGGMEDGGIGTDAIKISKALQEANSGEGVVVLADLGSAILSAHTAVELLDDALSSFIRIADAPIVEGAISAVIQASIGSSLDEVVNAAEEARSLLKL
ncbi:MAG TPA: dihydroxyacetone kinase phosphoryl donor subunit DhaM [Patescibacteria group bacterium]|nr:dihydroxyacetone kinase phosphoryl donor subunit DhaM [Patescibacteria group bacterium]